MRPCIAEHDLPNLTDANAMSSGKVTHIGSRSAAPLTVLASNCDDVRLRELGSWDTLASYRALGMKSLTIAITGGRATVLHAFPCGLPTLLRLVRHIDGLSAGKQVLRSDTSRVVALMANEQVRKRSVVYQVRDAMGAKPLPPSILRNGKHAVSRSPSGAGPLPALVGLGHMLPKPFCVLRGERGGW